MITRTVRVYGIVQGVGFRPTVARHASSAGVNGSVCNRGPYVEIIAQGDEAAVSEFLRLIAEQPPRRAAILKMDVKDSDSPHIYDSFEIVRSARTQGEIYVSPDLAVCDDCLAELHDRNNRRYQHPFINCTCCGPRLTILDSLPYDRERTSMKEFPMCDRCAEEYHNPDSRRYDAQPVCCNDCGPEYFILDNEDIRGLKAITMVRRFLSDGKIVAIKGIGGFHLACSATDANAVARLRKLKHRPAKPFAVMMDSYATIERNCEILPVQEEYIRGHQKPIVLMRRLSSSLLAENVAPENPNVGVMLPYAPVQSLIFDMDDGIDVPRCLVMTSGNLSGLPICRDDNDVRKEILQYTDIVLTNNRKIRMRADDSVMDFYSGKPYMIRRSRGFAPLPFILSHDYGKVCVTAYGGELKNTFCTASGNLFYPSSYIGDLTDLKGKAVLAETVDRMNTLLEAKPTHAVCDLHPNYNSSMAAEESGLPVIRVQHHYAHILSCMAENDYFGECIGIAMDGTGYAPDGSIWGGEILKCSPDDYERIGSIRPFIQFGGDAASREGYKIAISMLIDIYGEEAKTVIDREGLLVSGNFRLYKTMHDRRINSVVSTSCGRLFDAVSAILGLRKESSFEGEAATALEFCALEYEESLKSYPDCRNDLLFPELTDGDIIATDRIVRYITEGVLSGESSGKLAYEFHMMLAQGAGKLAACKAGEIKTAALSGGCFQNRLLLRMTERELRRAGLNVLTHSLIPPNDGGIAIGQALYGSNKLMKEVDGDGKGV